MVTDQSGELVKLPLLSSALNRLLRSANLTLDPEGTLRGVVTEVRWGAPADELRAQLLKVTEAERRKVLEDFLGLFLTGSTLQNLQIQNLEKPDESLVVSYSFTSQGYGKRAGDLLLVRLRVLGHKGEEVLEEGENKGRRYPIEFSSATTQGDFVEIALPEGYRVDELPPAVELKAGPLSYKSKTAATGNIIHYTRLYQVDEVEVPTEGLDELNKFIRQIAIDERSSAVLKRLSP